MKRSFVVSQTPARWPGNANGKLDRWSEPLDNCREIAHRSRNNSVAQRAVRNSYLFGFELTERPSVAVEFPHGPPLDGR
jgi:hypothetical protein